MSARIAWKQVAKRLADEAAFQQQGPAASDEDLSEAAAIFLIEAVEWWWHQPEGQR